MLSAVTASILMPASGALVSTCVIGGGVTGGVAGGDRPLDRGVRCQHTAGHADTPHPAAVTGAGHLGLVSRRANGHRDRVAHLHIVADGAADGLVLSGFGGINRVIRRHRINTDAGLRCAGIHLIGMIGAGAGRVTGGVAGGDRGLNRGVRGQYTARHTDAPHPAAVAGTGHLGLVGRRADGDGDGVAHLHIVADGTADGLVLSGFGGINRVIRRHRINTDAGLRRAGIHLIGVIGGGAGRVTGRIAGGDRRLNSGVRCQHTARHADAPHPAAVTGTGHLGLVSLAADGHRDRVAHLHIITHRAADGLILSGFGGINRVIGGHRWLVSTGDRRWRGIAGGDRSRAFVAHCPAH